MPADSHDRLQNRAPRLQIHGWRGSDKNPLQDYLCATIVTRFKPGNGNQDAVS
jgi:hypothetical protein